jgi:hypothetical protein
MMTKAQTYIEKKLNEKISVDFKIGCGPKKF